MTPTQPGPRAWRIGAAVVFVLAWVVRAAYLLELQGTEQFLTPLLDARGYDLWAQGLAGLRPHTDEVFFQAPLYPYLLSLVYRVAGRDLELVRSLQILTSAVAAVLLAGAGRRLFRSTRAGVLAGVLYALHPLAVFHDGQLEKTALGLAALCATLRLACASVAWRASSAFGCGLALGTLGLLRENALILAPVLAAWLALGSRERSPRRRAGDVALLALGTAIALSPPAIHNALHGTTGVLPTSVSLGVNLYIGNRRGADGSHHPLTYGAVGPGEERAAAVKLAEAAEGRPLTAGEVSDYWIGATVRDIRSDVPGWLRLLLRKWLLTWNHGEPLDSESHLVYADASHVLAGLLPLLPFSTLLALACWGAVATWPPRRTSQEGRKVEGFWLAHASVLALTASVAIFFIFGRYRMVLVPPLALLAGAGLNALGGPWSRRKAALFTGSLALGLLVSRLPAGIDPEPHQARAITWANLGVALAQQSRYEEAQRFLRRAVQLRPDLLQARGTLGELLFRLERPHDSEPLDAELLEVLPERSGPVRARIEYRLGAARLLLGRPADALGPLEAARAHAPGDAPVRAALAVAYRALGREGEALAEAAAAASATTTGPPPTGLR